MVSYFDRLFFGFETYQRICVLLLFSHTLSIYYRIFNRYIRRHGILPMRLVEIGCYLNAKISSHTFTIICNVNKIHFVCKWNGFNFQIEPQVCCGCVRACVCECIVRTRDMHKQYMCIYFVSVIHHLHYTVWVVACEQLCEHISRTHILVLKR